MKRPLSFFLAVLIGWGSVTQPARAFAPPLIYAAYMTASTGAGTYTLAALAGAIGVAGMYFTVKDAMDNEVRIPVGPNTSNQPPAPVAPATSSPQSTTKYRLGATCTRHYGSGVTAAEACAAASCSGGTTWYGSSGYTETYSVSGSCTGTRKVTRDYDNAVVSEQTVVLSPSLDTVVSCPSGYIQSGSSCQLVEARQATDDKRCDILVSNGQFATANDLNCPSTVDGSKVAPMIRDGKVIAYGTNSSGQPLMWEVTPGPQTYTIKEYQQIQTSTQTQIKTTTATVDAATSTVTSVQTSTSPGSISSPSAAASPQVTTSADPTTATNTPTVTKDETKPADLQTCGLPGSPACVIDDTQFDGKDTFSSPRNSEINDKLDQTKTQLENSKDSKPDIKADWLPSLMPGNATACSPLIFDFTLHNRITGTLAAPNVQLDLCDKLELVRAILGYMLGVWTVWYVWRRFTTANQGA